MDRLKSIYDDPATTTKNKRILARRAGTKQVEAEKFLKSLAAVQVTQKALPSSQIHYVPTSGPSGMYLCDVFYLKDYLGKNQKRSSVFTVMNINTRYAYSRALTSPVTSKKAADALKSILTEIKNLKYVVVLGVPASCSRTRRGLPHETESTRIRINPVGCTLERTDTKR